MTQDTKEPIDLAELDRLYARFNTTGVRRIAGWTQERHELSAYLIDHVDSIRSEIHAARQAVKGE